MLSPVQAAVLAACQQHQRGTFMPLSPDAWWIAEEPFAGGRAAFARVLRELEQDGYLHRRSGPKARYRLTAKGEEWRP